MVLISLHQLNLKCIRYLLENYRKCSRILKKVSNNYANLRNDFKKCDVKTKVKNIKWRDDMKLLHQMGNAYQYYFEHAIFPFITFRKLPNVINARWKNICLIYFCAILRQA